MVGNLPSQSIDELIARGAIGMDQPADPDQVQPSSFDVRLGRVAYRVRASFLPGPDLSVAERLEPVRLHEIDLTQGAVLETGCVYIVPLLEHLDLPDEISGSASPKSSTGRLDIFTRLLCDNTREFDQIVSGYRGPLYLEVSPRTFPILVRTGSRLSQIRLRSGDTVLSDERLKQLHEEQQLLSSGPAIISNGLAISIDLEGDENGLIGYRAKHHTAVVDVDKRAALEVAEFWEPIYRLNRPELILDPDEFYILVSREAVHVPPDYAAEMVPFDPLVGEFRVHYAGFFDPGFGHAAAGGHGSRAVLEVRSHEVPFLLDHGQVVGRLIYEDMAARPDRLYGLDLPSNYQGQSLKLSKHFNNPA